MKQRAKYVPGRAHGAHIDKGGSEWTLVLTRELRHPPSRVWEAITDPAHLSQWAPFDADRKLDSVGPAKLTTVNAPKLTVSETTVTRAEPPRLLEYNWGGGEMRWQLEPLGTGTRLTLWHNINRGFISMGAAGWHICFDVLDHFLAGEPLGRTVGPDALQVEGWHELLADYSQALGVEPPAWPKS